MHCLSRPRIKPDTVEERRYQVSMAEGCLIQDTLVILPTGLGKTVVALIVAASVLDKGKKVLMLAPTKPLVEQHHETFSEWLTDTDVGVMNGNMIPEKRKGIMQECDMVIATPQAVANDLENGLYDLSGYGLVIYDEAHRGVGNYAYVTVAAYNHSGISMGMTASPGSNNKKVMEMCNNLGFVRIDIRSDYDPDVSPYVHDTVVKRIEVNLPKDLTDISDILTGMLNSYVGELVNMGLMDRYRPPTVSHLLQVGRLLQARLREDSGSSYVYRGLVAQSVAVKISHAIMLAQTQGMTSLRNYCNRLKDESVENGASKSTKELVNRKEFKQVREMAENSIVEHPKISRVMSLVSMKLSADPDSKVMVFAQYRDTCDLIVSKVSGIPGVRVEKLIGQSKGGMKQKEQLEMLDRFRNGESNTLVCTSVGEEGLDISSTDLVIFYEPVPSEIRTIQRRGRTGRKNDGEVVMLIARDTMDEAFENSSNKKEELMRSRMERLNSELARSSVKPAYRGQMRLGDY